MVEAGEVPWPPARYARESITRTKWMPHTKGEHCPNCGFVLPARRPARPGQRVYTHPRRAARTRARAALRSWLELEREADRLAIELRRARAAARRARNYTRGRIVRVEQS